LILLKHRSTKLRARYRYGLKHIGSLRLISVGGGLNALMPVAIYVLRSLLGRNGDSTQAKPAGSGEKGPTRTLDRYGIRDFAVPE